MNPTTNTEAGAVADVAGIIPAVRLGARKNWRAPHTMPKDGTLVICAYRWGEKDRLRVTIGCWFTGDQFPGITDGPEGSYMPCVGWMPLPEDGLHEEFLPLHLRREEGSA
jgi:hypothetical protein